MQPFPARPSVYGSYMNIQGNGRAPILAHSHMSNGVDAHSDVRRSADGTRVRPASSRLGIFPAKSTSHMLNNASPGARREENEDVWAAEKRRKCLLTPIFRLCAAADSPVKARK